jgi:hypothetical protein
MAETKSTQHQAQGLLAKLLASENISIHHGNFSSAFFDVKNRILGLPNWSSLENKDIYDLLIGHEVGHALYTPADGFEELERLHPKCPKGLCNIVEDIRIERIIKDKFPGLITSFRNGYKALTLDEQDLFGLSKMNADSIAKLGFADRLNLRAKIGDYVNVPMDAAEEAIFARCIKAESFDDVLDLCGDILQMVRERKAAEKAAAEAEAPKAEKQPKPKKSEVKVKKPEVESVEHSAEEPDEEDEGESSTGEESNSDETLKGDSEGDTENEDSDASDETDDDVSGDASTTPSNEPTDNESDETSDTPSDQNADEAKESSESTTSAGSKGGSDDEDDDFDELDPVTDEAFNSGLEDISEASANKKGPMPMIPCMKDKCVDRVISFVDVMTGRKQHPSYRYAMAKERRIEDFKTFKHNSKEAISILKAGFERKKAAFQYSRATTSPRGTIDVNRLHAYKYDDQIFKSVTKLANCKDHGMVMFIDYSGSMDGVLSQVISQTLQLVMFAKAVSIPFEVYGFTDHSHSSYLSSGRPAKFFKADIRVDEIDLTGTVIFELLSSRMSSDTYDLALQELRAQAFFGGDRSQVMAKCETLGGTPLNETIIIAHDIVKEFKARTKVQKTIVVFLTDGDGCSMSTGQNCDAHTKAFGTTQQARSRIYGTDMTMKLHGRQIEFQGSGHKTYATLMQNLKITQDCVTIGYCIIPEGAAKYIPDKCEGALQWNPKIHRKITRQALETKAMKFKSEKFCAIEGGNGYDSFMLVSDAITELRVG